jgi:beta-glucosidase
MVVERKDDKIFVSVTVKNEGQIDGSEVVEVFVEAPKTKFIKPLRELKGFEKVFLKAGEQKQVLVTVDIEDIKYYQDQEWRLENGVYKMQICKDVNTVVLEKAFEITEGDILSSPDYLVELYKNKQSILAISDKDFEKVIQRPITLIETARPYDLNTPMREYKTWGGKFLFGVIIFVFKCLIKFASLGKDSDDKQTKIKNYYFAMRTIQTMSLRSLSYASEGMLTHRMALGLLDIANNKLFKGIGKLITKEKCVKLPK